MLFGTTVSASLGISNALGRKVHVPLIPEATINRIVAHDPVGLVRGQDVCFAAVLRNESATLLSAPSSSLESIEFSMESTAEHGVIASVDVQLRNSPQSPSGLRHVPSLPSHLHIKNMSVHESLRRKGIGQYLLRAIDNYAKTQTDAQMLTL